MTYYALFDSKAAQPTKVAGWFDTSFRDYNLPPATELFALTAEQWEARMADPNAWAVSGSSIVPYEEPVQPPTLAQQAQMLLAGGLTVSSASTPALDGVYAADAAAQMRAMAEMGSILDEGCFSDGTNTLAWVDVAGTMHTFPSPAVFRHFSRKLNAFVANCVKVQQGVSDTLPAAKVLLP